MGCEEEEEGGGGGGGGGEHDMYMLPLDLHLFFGCLLFLMRDISGVAWICHSVLH